MPEVTIRIVKDAAGKDRTVAVPTVYTGFAAYIHPLLLILPDTDSAWSMTKADVVDRTYDNLRLNEIATGLTGIISEKIPVLFGVDGVIAIPASPQLTNRDKVALFINGILGCLLLGGIYCEAVSGRDVQAAKRAGKKYIKVANSDSSIIASFHDRLRFREPTFGDALGLFHARRITTETLRQALVAGMDFQKKVPELSLIFLLHGVTALIRHDWGSALNNFWISSEQVTSHLWKRKMVEAGKHPKSESKKRRREFLEDHRTFTISSRQEILYQLGFIQEDVYHNLWTARKARNDLEHNGKMPERATAEASYNGLIGLLGSNLADSQRDFLMKSLRLYIEPEFTETAVQPIDIDELKAKNADPGFWRSLPKFPGEDE